MKRTELHPMDVLRLRFATIPWTRVPAGQGNVAASVTAAFASGDPSVATNTHGAAPSGD